MPKPREKGQEVREASTANPDPKLRWFEADESKKPLRPSRLGKAICLLKEKDLRFNSFANQVYLGNEPLGDIHLLGLQRWLQQVGLPRIGKETTALAIHVAAKLNPFDPPREYLKELRWDGTPRLATFWQDYYGADMNSEYLGAVGPNWWISLVARIMKPGCKVDTMSVLQGGHCASKSASLGIIGGQWFSENTQQLGTKDFYLSLTGKILVEISDFATLTKAKTVALKRILSCAVDTYRVPYAELPESFPRRTVFVGTTNDDGWASSAGERRYWPIACRRIDLDALARDRDQLFAEARVLFGQGRPWWIVPGVAG